MQIWAESGKSALPICNYSQILYQFLTFTQNLKRSLNFTIAIYICREYLRNKRNLSPPDVINLIEKHVLPVRPGRKDPRKVKPQASVSFLYRVA